MTGKTIAIVQSNYIPWKGYFDMIHMADEFVLLDDIQYTRRDWRNRNKIKTPNGLHWLTIPVVVKGKYFQRIDETQISDRSWSEQHWTTLEQFYRRAPCFSLYCDDVRTWYDRAGKYERLSEVNHWFLSRICETLRIPTKIRWSTEFSTPDEKSERLLAICLQAGASRYLSGPAAKGYLDVNAFRDQGIDVLWMDYGGYRPYPQLFGDYEHGVSVLDMLFNVGAAATQYLKSFT